MSLEIMKNAVLAAKPGLRQLVEQRGSRPILSYALDRVVRPITTARHEGCLGVIVDLVSRLHGLEAATSVEQALRADWYVSTAEHHGPLTHPFVVSSTFTQSLVQQRRGLNAIVVLSSAGISLNNSSFPRGFTYHDSTLQLQRLSFLPWKFRQQPVMHLAACTPQQYGLFVRAARKASEPLGDFFAAARDAFLSAPTYAEQISVVNAMLWRQLPGQQQMHLVYIPQETLVKELWLRFHLAQDTLLHHIVFDRAWRAAYARLFVGLNGAHSTDGARGTFLFWAVHNGHRLALRLDGDVLVSTDGAYRIPLNPEAIQIAWERNEIFPNLALCFITLSFYYGLNCGGGFSQVDYLPQHQAAFARLLAEQGGGEIAPVETRFLSADYAYISLQTRQQSVLATGLDMYIYNEEGTRARLKELAETVTVEQALYNLLPEFYAIVQGEVFNQPFISSPLPTCLYVPLPVLRQ